MRKFFSAKEIFTGQEFLRDHTVVVNEGKIENLISSADAPADRIENFDGCTLAPAFIDVQVYGAAGKLFARYPEPWTLRTMQEVFFSQGTILFQPTLATNTNEVFRRSIDALRKYWAEGGKGIPGLHLEGPWLNPKKRGAHVEAWIHPPTMEEVRALLDYGGDTIRMITIAPEVCSEEIIQFILSRGIIVSAGHSDITYDQAIKCFDAGIPAVTHLYNAMSSLHHRAPGLVGAAFTHRRVVSAIIPDGHHVDFAAIKIAKELMGSRLFAITDAVTETLEGPYRHQLAGDKYECDGILSGSSLSMHKAFVNLVRKVGIDKGEALRMCSLYPARLLLCDDRYGKIAPEYDASLLVLGSDLGLLRII
ncbi:MAG TPA: N-acetylglucosamine-6-phosphate deacetylase [Flavisolibacter sp.]|nr:N-acetylglucosamine-6-phosphate deacetylase [Flavisolibacter sp.]